MFLGVAFIFFGLIMFFKDFFLEFSRVFSVCFFSGDLLFLAFQGLPRGLCSISSKANPRFPQPCLGRCARFGGEKSWCCWSFFKMILKGIFLTFCFFV